MVAVWVGCQGRGFPLIIGFGLPGGVAFAFLGVGCLLVCLPSRRLLAVFLGRWPFLVLAFVPFLELLVVY